MIHDRDLLDRLEGLGSSPWDGSVYRHVLGSNPPDRPNTRGARWNPPGTAALYTSLAKPVARAEGDHLLAVNTFTPTIARAIHEFRIELHRVVDLGTFEQLSNLGMAEADIRSDDLATCQRIGGAVAWLGCDGLCVPSLRADGTNLVVLTGNLSPDAVVEPVASDAIT